MASLDTAALPDVRKETDSRGEVEVPANVLWGAQTRRSPEHFSIGHDLIPREMITAYATLKKAAPNVNRAAGRLSDQQQIAGTTLGSKTPVHSNDRVNMSQSSNDAFPSAMNIAAAVNATSRLLPAVRALRDTIQSKSEEWADSVKIGRTHMQDATPLMLGQEWSGYAAMVGDSAGRIEDALKGVYELALGGTAVGTGINAAPGFEQAAAAEIARLTQLPFVSAPNKFAVQGAHDALVQLSGFLRTLAVSVYKIANDIRLMSCGPRAGFAELIIPANEPCSSMVHPYVAPSN